MTTRSWRSRECSSRSRDPPVSRRLSLGRRDLVAPVRGRGRQAVEHLGALGGPRPRQGRQPQRDRMRLVGERGAGLRPRARAEPDRAADDGRLGARRAPDRPLRRRRAGPIPPDGGRPARARDRADGDAAPLRPPGVVRGPGRVRRSTARWRCSCASRAAPWMHSATCARSGSPSTSRTSTRPSGYVLGDFPPGRRGDTRAAIRVQANMARAHAAAYAADPRAGPRRVRLVGAAPPHVRAIPARACAGDRWTAGLSDRMFNAPFLELARDGRTSGPPGLRIDVPEMKGACDFVGINLYGRRRARFSLREWRSAFNALAPPPAGRARAATRARRRSSGSPGRRGITAFVERFADLGKPLSGDRERLRGRARPRAPVGDRRGGAAACTT